jgi:hypothetical protein
VREGVIKEKQKLGLKKAGFHEIQQLAQEFLQELFKDPKYLINIKRPEEGFKFTASMVRKFFEEKGYWIDSLWLGQFILLVGFELKKRGYIMTEKKVSNKRMRSGVTYYFRKEQA